MSHKKVLVTGVNGFIGAHVAVELLKKGYSVRGTVRLAKLASLRESLGGHYPGLELIVVEDIATSNLSEALTGIYAVIHVASHVYGRLPPPAVLESALRGTTNVLTQAISAGVQKVVLTGTVLSTTDIDYAETLNYVGGAVTHRSWGRINKGYDQLISGKLPVPWVYAASKILGEQAAWDLAEHHPNLDLAVILPPYVYGPYAKHFPVLKNALATNYPIYSLLRGKRPRIEQALVPHYCDVRDVARAHIAALSLPPADRRHLQDKRFLIYTDIFTWREALAYLSQVRPELMERFKPETMVGDVTEEKRSHWLEIDAERTTKVLKLNQDGGLIRWEQCLEDTIDSLLEAEAKWDLRTADGRPPPEIRSRL